jgi:hypothetical protein
MDEILGTNRVKLRLAGCPARQELNDRGRDLGRPAAGKVVANLVHQLHTGIRQDRGQLMGRAGQG